MLICLSIVRRARPDWVAVSMREAARAEGVNAERVSRLTTRVLAGFEALVSGLTRMGRPRKDATSTCGDNATANSELALTCGLMDVAASILRNVSLRKDAIRALIVGAYLRLRQEHPQLTQKRFCEALAVPERTLRTWLKHSHVNDNRSPVTEPKNPRRTRRRRPRRPRFGFDVTIPDDQFAADTTELRAFGLRLKLIATQDVGGRDQSLLDAIIVDDHESADLVVKVITKSLAERPGAQLLSDQGTPYLATTTRQALEQLQAEHAVQKQGHPQGKATLERAFGTIKHIAGPILSLTNRLASTLDGLAQPDLAIAASTLLLTALLRAYQAGARASRRACSAVTARCYRPPLPSAVTARRYRPPLPPAVAVRRYRPPLPSAATARRCRPPLPFAVYRETDTTPQPGFPWASRMTSWQISSAVRGRRARIVCGATMLQTAARSGLSLLVAAQAF
ncbi:MAG: hypothetical protein MJE77_11055, partial [Proteobacteria bacterium]|nr:hypothetical protein [Pseudomonadota bacterium]